MTEQTLSQETNSENKAGKIVRQVVQWAVLGLLLLTCILAAYRKFGG
jgi:hypothetical protein